MQGDPTEGRHAGQLRTVQNWIGGSDYSPRDALYVPPPPDTVDAYMDDLIAFMSRTDIPVLIQAAIAHAQFESIHPSPTATAASVEHSSTPSSGAGERQRASSSHWRRRSLPTVSATSAPSPHTAPVTSAH